MHHSRSETAHDAGNAPQACPRRRTPDTSFSQAVADVMLSNVYSRFKWQESGRAVCQIADLREMSSPELGTASVDELATAEFLRGCGITDGMELNAFLCYNRRRPPLEAGEEPDFFVHADQLGRTRAGALVRARHIGMWGGHKDGNEYTMQLYSPGGTIVLPAAGFAFRFAVRATARRPCYAAAGGAPTR